MLYLCVVVGGKCDVAVIHTLLTMGVSATERDNKGWKPKNIARDECGCSEQIVELIEKYAMGEGEVMGLPQDLSSWSSAYEKLSTISIRGHETEL